MGNPEKLMDAFMEEVERIKATPDDIIDANINLACGIFIGLKNKMSLQDYIDRLMAVYNKVNR